jgi:hypothetical protein
MSLRTASPVVALLLAGCDPFYGVDSHTALPAPADVRCVNEALASIPEAGQVVYERSESRSTRIFPKPREALTVMHVWLYGEGGKDILQINQAPAGWDYRNARSRMGVAAPQEEMVRFLPLMQKVNRVIQARCGLPVANLKHEPVGGTKPQEL